MPHVAKLDANKIGFKTKLVDVIDEDTDRIPIDPNDLLKFAIEPPNYFYVTIYLGNDTEIIKVIGRAGDKLIACRGLDDTEARRWLAGSCLEVRWNKAALRDFVIQYLQAPVKEC